MKYKSEGAGQLRVPKEPSKFTSLADEAMLGTGIRKLVKVQAQDLISDLWPEKCPSFLSTISFHVYFFANARKILCALSLAHDCHIQRKV